MKKVLETTLCKINYSESLQSLAKETSLLMENKILEYQSFFNIKLEEKVVINYFDDIDEFRNFIYEIRGEKESLPDYAEGTYDGGMVNAYIAPNKQLKRLHMANHELFHILYMKYILKNDYSKRIVWYDEGMAQFMSGENDHLEDINEFHRFYCKVRKQTTTIPILNDLEHGDSFVNSDYNGYDLSYLVIRYLFDTLSHNEFNKLMYDFNKIKEISNSLIIEMFNYYDYLNNSLFNPRYLFHGSPKLLEIIEKRQAYDSCANSENEDYAVFLTSSFIIASAYAFKDTIKKLSDGLDWNFEIGYDNKTDELDIRMDNVNVFDDLEGYIYVFPFNPNYDHQNSSIQYKCYENIKPIDIIKVKFAQFKKYYKINKETNVLKIR